MWILLILASSASFADEPLVVTDNAIIWQRGEPKSVQWWPSLEGAAPYVKVKTENQSVTVFANGEALRDAIHKDASEPKEFSLRFDEIKAREIIDLKTDSNGDRNYQYVKFTDSGKKEFVVECDSHGQTPTCVRATRDMCKGIKLSKEGKLEFEKLSDQARLRLQQKIGDGNIVWERLRAVVYKKDRQLVSSVNSELSDAKPGTICRRFADLELDRATGLQAAPVDKNKSGVK